MPYLCDTSIILRLAEPENPVYKDVESVIDILGGSLVLVPQVMYEYWVVATRPKSVNGQGLTSAEAKFELDRFEEIFLIFHDTDTIYSAWKNLIAKYKIIGKISHDARLVAAMKVHQIDSILTLNPKDFQRFDDINVVTPADITN